MKKFLSLALTLVLALVLALPCMVEPAHADLVHNARLRVVPASELREEHYHVYYGPQYLYVTQGLMDVREQMASPDGLVYNPVEPGADEYDIFIEPEENYVITSATIIKGSVEYYSRGIFVRETNTIDIDNPKLLIIRGREMSYTDGEGAKHIEEGGSPNRNLPNNYNGVAYYSEPDYQQNLSFLTIAITTEPENSGAFVLEETSTGTRLEPQYTIKAAGSTFTGTATEVNDKFAMAVGHGDIKHGDTVEVLYDIDKVGFILVRKGDSGYTDPEPPDWIVKEGSISFKLDKDNRAMRIMYNASPGSVKLVEGSNPLGLKTQIEVFHYKNLITKDVESFTGDVNAVNAKIAEWIYNVDVWNGDDIYFRLISPENVDSVSVASKRINYGREESMSPFEGNVLEGSAWSLTLTNQRAYEYRINYHRVPGLVYIQESAPGQGSYSVSASTPPYHVSFHETTAVKACTYINNAIKSGMYRVGVGSIISVTFPNNIASVRVGFGSKPSVDITKQLVNNTYSYAETAEDAHFFVVFKNSGGEIIINPTVPIDPDVPPFDPDIFGGGDTGTVWPNPDGGTDWTLPAGGTGCTCPWCSWVTSMSPEFATGIPTKPDWSVQLSVSPKDADPNYDVAADTTVLAADEVYTFTADTDVLLTITPVGNHPVTVSLSYTVDGKTHDFKVTESTGTITATVCGEVTVDVEMGKTGFAAQMPTAYAVHLTKPVDGTVYRDHNTALAGDTVTIAAMPNSGKTVDTVRVLTISGESIPVQYLGHSTKGYAVYTFAMPAEAVHIDVSFQ